MSRSDLLLFLNRIVPCGGLISKMFDGIFYTNEENRWLDGFATQLGNDSLSSPERTSLLRYLLYQACLRKRPFNLFHRANLGLRTNAGVRRSFGNLVTWERSFDLHILQAYDELPHDNRTQGPECVVLSSQNVEDVAAGYDLVYIDPPYVSSSEQRNWDNYWRRYHFLEGLARYEEWEQLIDPHSNIRLLAHPEWIAPWSRRGTFAERLFALVEKHRDSIVVLSYVSDAYPRDDEIKSFFQSRFARVVTDAMIHTHALSPSTKRELIFIGLPK